MSNRLDFKKCNRKKEESFGYYYISKKKPVSAAQWKLMNKLGIEDKVIRKLDMRTARELISKMIKSNKSAYKTTNIKNQVIDDEM